jgi:hypothetical protein
VVREQGTGGAGGIGMELPFGSASVGDGYKGFVLQIEGLNEIGLGKRACTIIKCDSFDADVGGTADQRSDQ